MKLELFRLEKPLTYVLFIYNRLLMRSILLFQYGHFNNNGNVKFIDNQLLANRVIL